MTVMILTGLGPGGGGVVLTGGAGPSPDSSSWLVMSSVVKRLDRSPRMWMIANLLEGFGCKQIHQGEKIKDQKLNIIMNRDQRDQLFTNHHVSFLLSCIDCRQQARRQQRLTRIFFKIIILLQFVAI